MPYRDPDAIWEYRRAIEQTIIPHFGTKVVLSRLTPKSVQDFVNALPDSKSDAWKQNQLNPLKSAFAQARRLGLVRQNPCDGAVLPHREVIEEDDERVKVFTSRQVRALILVCPPKYRLLLWTLAETGLRISEAIALRWQDIEGDCIRVRRAYVRGAFKAPKSRHGVRRIPLSADLREAVYDDRTASVWHADSDLVSPRPGLALRCTTATCTAVSWLRSRRL
jgi:integrase